MINLSNLQSAILCSRLIAEAQDQRVDLEQSKDNLLGQQLSSAARAAMHQTDVAQAAQKVADLTALRDSKPAGSPEYIIADGKLFIALGRQKVLSVEVSAEESDIERQQKLARVDALIATEDVYITALEAKLVELQAA